MTRVKTPLREDRAVGEAAPGWAIDLAREIGALRGAVEQVHDQACSANERIEALDKRVTDGFARLQSDVNGRVSVAVFGKTWNVAKALFVLSGASYTAVLLFEKLRALHLV
ncbi:MAG TPA: hypothetical protein VNL16_07400 [Chloroflexota bacterium]|nr:hypothetical protein [Chloroflexota bacterium]